MIHFDQLWHFKVFDSSLVITQKFIYILLCSSFRLQLIFIVPFFQYQVYSIFIYFQYQYFKNLYRYI